MQGYFIWILPLRYPIAGKGSAMDPHSLMGESCVGHGILVITSSEMLNAALNILHSGRLC